MTPARELPHPLDRRAFSVQEGLRRGVLEKRMRGRDLYIPYRGVRTSNDDLSDIVERCHAYAQRLGSSQCFSHATAALLWGIPLPLRIERDSRLHVASWLGTRPRLPGAYGHELSGSHVRIVMRSGLPVTDPATTFLHLARVLNRVELVAAGDHLVLTPRRSDEDRRPYIALADLNSRVSEFTGVGARRAHEAGSLVRDGAESARESRLRLQLLDEGLPEPELNSMIRDDAGHFIAYGDLVYPSVKVLVEYDGEQHRTVSEQYRRDIERHDTLIENHWCHIRVGKHSPLQGARSAPSRTRQALLARGVTIPGPAIRQLPPRFQQKKGGN